MKLFLLIFFALVCLFGFLTGCTGAMGGGASYRASVSTVTTDGRPVEFRASADTVQNTDGVSLDFSGNPLTGDITGLKFSKTGVASGAWSNSVVEKLVERIPVPVSP